MARRSKDPAAGAGVTTHTVNGIGIGGSAEPTQGMTRDGLAADLARVSVTVEILPPFVLCNRLPCAFEYILVCRESGAASDDDVASSASPTPTPPSSDSPRAVGTQKRFKCPAGCDRFFTHAPAAVQHGKTCAAKQASLFFTSYSTSAQYWVSL